MKKMNQKGEGMVQNILFVLILAGLGYAGYTYLWPMVSGPSTPAAQTAAPAGDPKAGSMAGAAVQGAAAAGEVYGSGR